MSMAVGHGQVSSCARMHVKAEVREGTHDMRGVQGWEGEDGGGKDGCERVCMQ